MRAVQADDAHLQQLQFARQFQYCHKPLSHRFEVVAAERANGVVIGMSVGRQIAYRHISVSGPFNAPGTENAVGITVNEQRQHQMGRILLVATPFVVDRKGGQRQPLDRGNHKMYQVVLRYPFAQVRRQKHGCIPVRILESLRHSCIIDASFHTRVQSPTGS